jgi:hypothetical protein
MGHVLTSQSRFSVAERGFVLAILSSFLLPAVAAAGPETFPPRLPEGQDVVTDTSDGFLRPPGSLRRDVAIARTSPTVDFLYYPGQTYPGQPWSNWGDGLAIADKYYSSIGDHRAIGVKDDGPYGTGTARIFEYDPATKSLRLLVDVAKVLSLPDGHYTPGKIHSRLDLGRDGRLYFSTHRGAEKATIDRNHYQGDWILRCEPRTGDVDVVVQGPVPKHSIPCGLLDPDRLIFTWNVSRGGRAWDCCGLTAVHIPESERRP